MIVLDTDVVSELMRRDPDHRVREWIQAQVPAQLWTTSVTVAEVRYGIARLPANRRRELLSSAAEDVFGRFADRVLPFDVTAARSYPEVVVERAAVGSPISGFDAQIAAICRVSDAVLATRNTADFDDVGLHLVDPWD